MSIRGHERMSTVKGGSRFALLVSQVKEGSQDAAWELVELYGPHVLRVVRRSLNREMRPTFDSQDFVQAVWASFFTHRDRFLRIETPQQLVGLLAAMVKNKVADEARRRSTQKHDWRRERSIDDSDVVIHGGLTSTDATPSQIAIARERWSRLMQQQSERSRQIVHLRLAGQTHQTIAQALGVSQKTVQRVLRRLLQEQDPDDS